MIITCKGYTVVWLFNNSQKEYKNNGRLVWSNNILENKIMEVILGMPILINYILNMNTGCS